MSTTSKKGFTIIELLVALGVTALLVTLMINIVSTVLINWNRTSGTLSTGNQARLVLDQISQDLQGSIMKMDAKNVWLAASIQTGKTKYAGLTKENWPSATSANEFKPDDSDPAEITDSTDSNYYNDSLRLYPGGLKIEDYRFGHAGVWLRFFCIPSGANQSGGTSDISAPRAVSYQIIRRQIGGASSAYAYQLFRAEVDPDVTFNAGYDLYSSTNGYNSQVAAPLTAGAKDNIRSPVEAQVIASGVVDFGVRFFVHDTNDTDNDSNKDEAVEIFPVNRTTSASGSGTAYAFAATSSTATLTEPGGASPVQTGFPTVAEIMIRVLTPEGIRLIEAKEAGQPVPNDWWEIVEQNSNVYTRRIDLKSTAL